MSNIEKIAVNGHYIWVDKDAEIEEGDWFYWKGDDVEIPKIMQCSGFTDDTHYQVKSDNEFGYGDWSKFGSKKIIAASPELGLEGVPTYVEWLAEQHLIDVNSKVHKDLERDGWIKLGFIKGYQTRDKELLDDDMCYHECPSCNIRCNCSTQPCSCCNEPQPTWDDVRNKMTPFTNLIALIENGQLKGSVEIHDILNQEIAECKKFIEKLKQSKK